MPNTELTDANLKKRIESRLGGKGVQVELEQDDYIESIKSALDYYNQRRPFKRNAALPVSTGQRRYVLNLAQHPGLQGITYLEFVTSTGTTSGFVDPFDPFYSGSALGAGLGSGEGVGALSNRLSYAEDANRIMGGESEWHAGWEVADYVVYISVVRPNVLCSYEWSGHYSHDQNASTGMQLIPNGDVDWFIKYATACAKETLGRIRGKFQGITNPDGAQDPVDYAELLTESQQEKEKLELELDKRRPPLAPLIE